MVLAIDEVVHAGLATVRPAPDVVSYRLVMWVHNGQGRYLRPHLEGTQRPSP